MNTLLKMLTAAGVVAGFAGPALAQDAMVDPMTMTCADFSAMDSAGMMSATHSMDMVMAMTDEERTAATAMTDDEKATANTAAEASMAKMTEACKAMPDGTAMDALKAMK